LRYKINSTWLIAGGGNCRLDFFVYPLKSGTSAFCPITRKGSNDEPILTQQHGNILEITLNRPTAYNALNLDMMKMLGETLPSAATDHSIKGVLITGRARHSVQAAT
jgi:1,4-dihydroxy-2-naphthoyl-CoA synthase